MAYSSGHDILDDEYNKFATGSISGTPNHSVGNVNSIYGSGSGNIGYGQTLPAPAVTAGTIISATQWANLLNAISTAASHQGTPITAVSNPTTGDDVAIISALQQNIDNIFYGRLNCAATGTPYTAGGSVNRTTSWQTSVTFTHTITFPSVNQMRYFFNAGGRITVSSSRTGGSVTDKNAGWTSLCTQMGTINIASPSGAVFAEIAGTFYSGTTKTGGSGTPTILETGIGIYNLTATNQTLFRQFSTGYLYEVNYVDVIAKVSGSTITITTKMTDAAADGGGDIVDGTLNCTVTAVPAATTYISNSWGTPTISGSQTGS